MARPAPSEEQSLSFYRAALAAARWMDRESEPRVLDADADAAWRAYGSDLPSVVRCDLVLRDFAMLYPAAFAPGPVFGLSGWYVDDPWGTGFERPAAKMIEGLFAMRGAPADVVDALDQAFAAWGLPMIAGDGRLSERLSPSTNAIVTGVRATAEVARAFVRDERLSARTQVILVTDRASCRHVLGVACALRREAGVPLLADVARRGDEDLQAWAARTKQRLDVAQARLLVVSHDAEAHEVEAARALAVALGADETVEVAAS